jgi:hypothetical protein
MNYIKAIRAKSSNNTIQYYEYKNNKLKKTTEEKYKNIEKIAEMETFKMLDKILEESQKLKNNSSLYNKIKNN